MRAVAAFAFREATRRRLVLVAAVLSAVFLGLFAVLAHLVAAPDATFGGAVPPAARGAAVALFGVYLARPLCGLLAILLGVGSLAPELEGGALQAVLARPLRRHVLLLGRYLGLCALLVPYTLLLQGGVLVLGALVGGGHPADPAAVAAWLVVEPMMLCAVGVLASTFLPTVTAGAGCVLLYAMAVGGGDLQQLGAFLGARTLSDLGVVTALLLPADVPYREAVLLGSHGAGAAIGTALGPLFVAVARPDALLLGYAAAYVAGALVAACAVFGRRDV